MTRPPSDTVHFLFTDIEGERSSRGNIPETWEVARGQYHFIVCNAAKNSIGPYFYLMLREVSSTL